MRTLFIMTSLGAGGLENYVLRFLNQFPDLNVDILCKGGVAGELESKYLERLTPEHFYYKHFGYLNVLSYLWLFRLIKRNNYTTVCDFTGNFSGPSMLVSKLANVPNRITFYRNSRNHFKMIWYNNLYDSFVKKLVSNYSTKVLSNSKSALEYYFGKDYPSEYRVIYNGVSIIENKKKGREQMRQELGIPQNAFVVGHTGRLDTAKNHATIIKVAQKLCIHSSDIYVVCIGKNVPLLQNKDLHKNILLLNYRSDIGDILKAFDVYYFPSLWEGQPNAMIEAMIAGLPIVSSNIDCIKESVPNYFEKYLIDPNNVESAVNTLLRLREDSRLREKYRLQEWAIEQYDPIARFTEFKDMLE